MNARINEKTLTTQRSASPHANQDHERKHAAVERWLHRSTQERNVSQAMRWFG